MEITECEGYKKLLSAVKHDEQKSPGFHDYYEKLNWVVERAKNYSEKTGVDPCDILNTWEKNRSYWYMNYYQNCNQPILDGPKVRVFETQNDLTSNVGESGFRCPLCGGVSSSPYECTSGIEIRKGVVCDWKVYGLLRDLGKGIFVFVKDKMHGETIFMPLAWE